ncbi:GntR family transcriptional regulator [Actinomadura verrucosospora]|uniref:Transcriptional regulator, GntR family with UTRAsensor domain n=1 Tax=Actinomadura verrucosospora TaxID=46165 RepID=A0A7D3VVW7_ACTVE|nr:GntR family transcriptional regulator [Actinomadura verrucosospora]QKG24540.1 Transcriptional regulator, GntR family with UTRAsensor domain [Actinomadura verrucosospora]
MYRPRVIVDRSSPVPLYYQLARQLEAAIQSGELTPGTRLENELEIAERCGLSRPTVRQAIQHLVDRGLLVRKRGVGTQVVLPEIRRPVELTSLHDDLAAAGQEPQTDVLEFGPVPADDTVAKQLGVAAGATVLRMRRTRHTGGEPLALLTNYLPEGLLSVTADDLARHGLYELLRASGVNLRIANQSIGARRATAEEARLLDERRGVPMLTMTRTAYDDKGTAIEFGRHVYRASRYSYALTLVER